MSLGQHIGDDCDGRADGMPRGDIETFHEDGQ
jgi:hypothetical protein